MDTTPESKPLEDLPIALPNWVPSLVAAGAMTAVAFGWIEWIAHPWGCDLGCVGHFVFIPVWTLVGAWAGWPRAGKWWHSWVGVSIGAVVGFAFAKEIAWGFDDLFDGYGVSLPPFGRPIALVLMAAAWIGTCYGSWRIFQRDGRRRRPGA